MAARRATPDDWLPVSQMQPYGADASVHYGKRAKIVDGAYCYRQTPVGVRRSQTQPALRAAFFSPPSTRIEGAEDQEHREISHLAALNAWPLRSGDPTLPPAWTRTPRTCSRCTSRRSDTSSGILDYYIREPSPPQSLRTPPLSPEIDPAMKLFDFELTPRTPGPRQALATALYGNEAAGTKSGAESASYEKVRDVSPKAPTAAQAQARMPRKKSYKLFPKVDERPRTATLRTPPRKADGDSPPTPQRARTGSSPTALGAHRRPDPSSHHARQDSVSWSLRGRKDSFTSYYSSRHHPLQMLSSSSTGSSNHTATTPPTSLSSASPSERSGRRNDTATSPVTAPALGAPGASTPLGGEKYYPACFFEDDDDDDDDHASLWKKLAEKLPARWTRERWPERKPRSGRLFDETVTLGQRLRRATQRGGWATGHPAG